jgi:hypothetical protein
MKINEDATCGSGVQGRMSWGRYETSTTNNILWDKRGRLQSK